MNAAPYHVTYRLTGDGNVVGPTIASATLITDMAAGLLEDIFSATYANQAAMRTAVLEGGQGICVIQSRAQGNDVTAEHNQIQVDVDVDAVTPARPEVNIEMSDTTGQICYITFLAFHSVGR
jgi:hypothetical protein